MKPFYIDENINVHFGENAIKKLSEKNDSEFLEENFGILKVSQDRWKSAQKAEKKHWFEKGSKSSDDRNYYHLNLFDNFRILKQDYFENVLEVGCGPFTNLRLISSRFKINNIDLLDPLIKDYLNHEYCSYNEYFLFGEKSILLSKLITRFFPFAYKFYKRLFSKKIPIDRIISKPFEEISHDKVYDMVVMINVIEHCYDIRLMFENLLKVTQKGSYFVFSDKIYNYLNIKEEIEFGYDEAHPLKPEKDVIISFLNKYFDIEFENIKSNSINIEEEKFVWDDMYLICKRK